MSKANGGMKIKLRSDFTRIRKKHVHVRQVVREFVTYYLNFLPDIEIENKILVRNDQR